MDWIDSVLGWLVLAAFVCWFFGAHNRLMRLRSAVLRAYGALDAALQRQLDYVQAQSAQYPSSGGEPLDAALRAATVQFGALLGATRARPLDPAAIGALATALHILLAAWQRVHPESVQHFEADGTLSRPAPLLAVSAVHEPVPMVRPLAWPEPSPVAEMARSQFNLCVAQYNAAIRQFPAVLVAWLFRFRAAMSLEGGH